MPSLPSSPRSRPVRVLVALVTLVLTTLGLTACTPRPRIAVFGDSLAIESHGPFAFTLGGGYALEFQTYGGTALCDYVERIEAAARTHPAAIVIEFSGNDGTACMAPFTGSLAAQEARYRWDATRVANVAAAQGVPVIFVGAPPVVVPRADVNTVYRDVAAANPRWVHFVDAGRAVAAPDGSWTATLACRAWEAADPVAFGCVDGQIPVRTPDRLHFCPTWAFLDAFAKNPTDAPCPVHSSGAFRYWGVVADALHELVPAAPA